MTSTQSPRLAPARSIVLTALAVLCSALSPAGAQHLRASTPPSGDQLGSQGTIQSMCFGDGTGAQCPCVNGAPGHGCANSNHPEGALMEVLSGSASIMSQDLRFRMTSHRLSTTAWLLQGNVPFGPAVFGDGLQCVGPFLTQIYVMVGNMDPLDTPSSPPIAVKGGISAAGTVRGYFMYYRDPTIFCTTATFNASNAMRVVWAP
jgi:hypothetical protein